MNSVFFKKGGGIFLSSFILLLFLSFSFVNASIGIDNPNLPLVSKNKNVDIRLNQLDDVNTQSPTDGQVIAFNSTSGEWYNTFVNSTAGANSTSYWDRTGTTLSPVNSGDDINMNGGSIIANMFSGLFNWTEDSPYLSFDGNLLSYNESKLNETILLVSPSTNMSLLNDTYVNIDGDTMTGDLQISDNSSALKSGNYPFYMKSSLNAIGTNPNVTDSNIISYWKMDDNATIPPTTDTGVIGYWKTDTGSGTSMVDSSGNSYDGTLTSTTWTGSGYFGYNGDDSLTFDGTSSFSDLSSHAANLKTATGSIEMWFKADVVTDKVQVLYGGGYSTTEWFTIWLGGNMNGLYADESLGIIRLTGGVHTYQAYVRKGKDYYNDGIWHHLVVTQDGNGIKIYIDGVSQTLTFATGTSSTAGWTDINNLNSLFVGKRVYTGSPAYFQGKIDNLIQYNDARTPQEVEMDYASGLPTKIADSVGINTGNITNAVWTNSGAFGYTGDDSLTFDGSVDYVTIPDSADMDLTDNFTIYAWVKTSSTTRGGIIDKLKGTTPYEGYTLVSSQLGDGKVSFFTAGSGWVYSTTNIADGSWHMIAITSSGSSGKMYIDGVAETTFTSTALLTNSETVTIGVDYLSNYFNGQIDNIVIYNTTVRTPSEILLDYNNALSSSTVYISDTTNAFGSSAKLWSFRNSGTEKSYIDGDGGYKTSTGDSWFSDGTFGNNLNILGITYLDTIFEKTLNNGVNIETINLKDGNITGNWFKGLFNWTEDSPYLSFDGNLLSYNESKLNETILSEASVYNNSADINSINTTSNIEVLVNDSYVNVAGEETIKLIPNSTSIICNLSNEGVIYYDGTIKKMYGCNSTDWNSLW